VLLLVDIVDVALVIVVEAEEFRWKSSVPAEYGETEYSYGQPELGTQNAEDNRFPEAIHDSHPHHGKI